MPLLTLVIVLILIGVALWLINSYIPMDRKIKTILNIVVVIVAILFVLQAFGVIDELRGVRVPQID
jgi:hypothetical protein